MSGKDDFYLGDLSLVFILHLNIYSAKRGEPKRMLGSYKESPEGLQVSSRVFQRVEVPSPNTFKGIQHSVEFLEPPQVEVVSFKHYLPSEKIGLKPSEP
jgi:hypothetical protein